MAPIGRHAAFVTAFTLDHCERISDSVAAASDAVVASLTLHVHLQSMQTGLLIKAGRLDPE